MNYSTNRFTLELHRSVSQISIPIPLGDTGRVLEISFSDGGAPYIIAEGCLAMVTIKRPSKTFIQVFCPIRNKTTVIYEFAKNQDTAIVEGVHDCDVTIIDSEGITIGSAIFSMVVSDRVVNLHAIEVSDEDRTAIDAILGAEAARQAAENERETAESERATAEALRLAKDEERIESVNKALKAAEEASESVNFARISEDNAKLSEFAAESSRIVCEAILGDAQRTDARISRNDKRITNLEKARESDLFESDSSVAYTKDVPDNALPYAEILKLGGMTKRSDNLIRYPYRHTTVTQDGLTFTDNGDGSITIKGTATTHSDFKFVYGEWMLPKGTYTVGGIGLTTNVKVCFYARNTAGNNIARFDSAGVTTDTIAEEYEILDGYIRVMKDTTVDITVCPMLNEGATALPYEPYFDGLRSANVTEIKSTYKNLIDYKAGAESYTNKGITFINNGDGSITVNGTHDNSDNSAATYFFNETKVNPIQLKYGVTYRIDGVTDNVDVAIFSLGWSETYRGSNNNLFAIKDESLPFGSCLMVNPDTTVNNVTVYPQIKPDKEIEPLPIAAEVKAIDGYGWGVNDSCYNYIDFENKVFVKKVGKIDLGTLNWEVVNGITSRFVATLTKRGKPTGNYNVAVNAICDKYSNLSQNTLYNNEIGVAIQATTATNVYVYDSAYTDVATFKASMSGVMLYYELAEPEVIDISDLLSEDNFIEVEGGGDITVVNEFMLAVPSEIVYMLKEGTI